MAAYSFKDTSFFIAGPGLAANVGAGSAVAEEGIDFEAVEDKNVMTIGADGKGQHSLIASDAAVATLRLLKTSPLNAVLMAAYDLQSSSSALWGRNVMSLSNSGLGDVTAATQAAFKKKPKIMYKKEGEMMEWTFDCVAAQSVLGTGGGA